MTNTGKIVIAGGTGFIGINLARNLKAEGREVVLISRHPPRSSENLGWLAWDGYSLGAWAEALEDADALVNLVGRTVDCVKTPDHCDEILRSRVESTTVLGAAIRSVQNPPHTWIQMSTSHRYGDPPERVCDERSPFGYGLAPFVGQAWEEAFARAVLPETRQVILRTSFVLGRSGGALPRLMALARWGLGGRCGSGRQGVSWIHESDMNKIFVRALSDESMSGAYLATSPNPKSNAEFMRALRKAIGMPIGLPAYTWMVRIGAPLLLRTDPELALFGRYCIPRRLIEEGFNFEFPDLSTALSDLCKNA